MQKILWFLFAAFVCMPAFAGVGRVDNREYVDWSTPPYNKIVYFTNKDFTSACTAQYVAPDIILTARHCVVHDSKFDNNKSIGNEYRIITHSKNVGKVVLEKYGYDEFSADWALLRVSDAGMFSNEYFNVAPETQYTTIDNAGFGYMRILSDYDIKKLRQVVRQIKNPKQIDKLQQQIKNNTYTTDELNKAQSLYDDLNVIKTRKNTLILSTLSSSEEFGKILQEEGIQPLLDVDLQTGLFRLKAHRDCKFVKHSVAQGASKILGEYSNSTVANTCDSFEGNSGGPYFINGILYGICSKGNAEFNDVFNVVFAVKTEVFYDALQEMKKTSPIPKNNNNVIIGAATAPAPNVDVTEQEIQRMDTDLTTQLEKTDTMSDAEFVAFLDKLTEYQVLVDRYNQARQNQQSTANKTLTALTVAATGIGGMMLASGVAAQNADAAAESDMRAFLGTFRCDYGAGKNIMGGDVNVELPGINALTPLVTEYISLASDLKSRKAALGMPPGIESDVLMDTAAGLYDNASTGITDGHYTSVSRALTNAHGRDADELAAQKQKTKTKTTAGGVIGGAGLVGGAIGNAIINRDKK